MFDTSNIITEVVDIDLDIKIGSVVKCNKNTLYGTVSGEYYLVIDIRHLENNNVFDLFRLRKDMVESKDYIDMMRNFNAVNINFVIGKDDSINDLFEGISYD
jgi:hypothetical protein